MTSVHQPATGSAAFPAPGARQSHPLVVPRTLAVLALLASAATAAFGLAWLLVPAWNPFEAPMSSQSLASALLGPLPFAAVVLATGAVGVIVGAVAASPARLGRQWSFIGWAGALLAVAESVVLGSVGTVAFAGYLFGFAAVLAGIATTAVLLVRAPRLGLPLLALLAALIGVAVWSAGLNWDGITTFLGKFGTTLAANGLVVLLSAVSVAAVLSWAAIAVLAGRTTSGVRRFEARLVRHRRALTVLAALGPLPYAIMRASWLTPWPQFAPVQDELDATMLTIGLMLGSGAVAASVLTLGLILPWGRRFPAWMPRIGGRAVPVRLAVVPGLAAATVLCMSAVPIFLMSLVGTLLDAVVLALVLPLWFWGPMLALAVWAYAAWRARSSADDPAQP